MLGAWLQPLESWFGLPLITIILLVFLVVYIIKD